MSIKEQLYEQIQQLIDQRVSNAQKAMYAAATSKSNQTKSSAGDKFETGRAMMQAEEDRSKVQLIKAMALKNELAKFNVHLDRETVDLGSLVITNQGNYFLSVGIGKLSVDNTTYYAISPASPIGQLLVGKKPGEKVIFREKAILIREIV